MHELLHFASGARTPIVMFNVNRTPASPWGFWPDQIDSLSKRDTGWVQLYSENPQDSFDSVVQAYRIAEASNLPVMVNHDAFYVSHSVEPVSLPSPEKIAGFLPRQAREITLGDGSGSSLGAPIDQASWNQTRRELYAAMKTVEALTLEAGREWEALTGRASAHRWSVIAVTMPRYLFITMGSMCGTVREAIDRLRACGQKAGLLKIRLFRPLPAEAIRAAVAGVKCAIVLGQELFTQVPAVCSFQELKAATLRY